MQRFREGFTAIPPMRTLGERWDRDVAGATQEARGIGATIARELSDHGIDFTFAPVLDLDHGASGVIGDRAFHRNPNAAAHLAAAFVAGLRSEGMAAVGKHFPGHGHVAADSHDELPRDERSLAAITAEDLVPFAALARRGLGGMMPAHVVYPAVDAAPAGFSAQVAAGNPAGPARVRRRDLLRRSRHGRRARRRRCRRARGGGARRGMRHGARLQRSRRRRHAARAPCAAASRRSARAGSTGCAARHRGADRRRSGAGAAGVQCGCGQRPPSFFVNSSAVCATTWPSCLTRSSGSRDDGPASEMAPSGSACSS